MQALGPLSLESVTLPVDIQREVLFKAMEHPHYICPKDNGHSMRKQARLLASLSLVCHEWKDMAYPLLYANVSLPTSTHLQRFTNTLVARPEFGLWTRYFHYYGSVFPAGFLPDVFYRLPNLEHFLSQAAADGIPDDDIDDSFARPKLITLEIDPGVHDGEGNYRDASVQRWADLSELRSLALVGLEAIANILPTNGASFPNLVELHLLHQEDDLDPDPASHSLLLAILSHVGSQLHLLRIDECSSDILSAPKEIFTLCPNLVTLSVSGLDLQPLVDEGHAHLKNWLLGDPWNYHNHTASEFERVERESDRFDYTGASETVAHRLTDDDRDAVRQVLAADKANFPSLELVLLWNLSFEEAENRTSPELRQICEAFSQRAGWKVGDRFAVGRDDSWAVEEGNPDLGWVTRDDDDQSDDDDD